LTSLILRFHRPPNERLQWGPPGVIMRRRGRSRT
jgi:hypothetical protein